MIGGPWEPADFTDPCLREAWDSYQAAIKHIETVRTRFLESSQPYCDTLIKLHKEKCAVLERAQRIINTARAIKARGHKQSTEVMQ